MSGHASAAQMKRELRLPAPARHSLQGAAGRTPSGSLRRVSCAGGRTLRGRHTAGADLVAPARQPPPCPLQPPSPPAPAPGRPQAVRGQPSRPPCGLDRSPERLQPQRRPDQALSGRSRPPHRQQQQQQRERRVVLFARRPGGGKGAMLPTELWGPGAGYLEGGATPPGAGLARQQQHQHGSSTPGTPCNLPSIRNPNTPPHGHYMSGLMPLGSPGGACGRAGARRGCKRGAARAGHCRVRARPLILPLHGPPAPTSAPPARLQATPPGPARAARSRSRPARAAAAAAPAARARAPPPPGPPCTARSPPPTCSTSSSAAPRPASSPAWPSSSRSHPTRRTSSRPTARTATARTRGWEAAGTTASACTT